MLERPDDHRLPTQKADVENLRTELERLYQDVKATSDERREQAQRASPVGMVIRGK